MLGVLSGGYTRFFNGQPANGYGTVSFYQPLYLYWDWIAANNPYHYVAAQSGNGLWTDPTHWVSTLDPAYNILVGGAVVNGIPTNPGEQKFGTGGDFGQICFQSGGTSDCYDTRTGNETVDRRPIGQAESQPASADLADATGQIAADSRDDLTPERKAQADQVALALPAATLASGLPGATNFVPNNADPVRRTSSAARYFDVTLATTGITTLTAPNNITIDRLTIGTAGAQLVIDGGATLNTLINTTQFAGFVTVNGRLNTVGDYSLMGGGLLGTGRIDAPFLTSLLGQIAPGTTSTIGTLTIGGNLVLTSGNSYLVNLGANGTSDLLSVVATSFGATNQPTNGIANLGGTVSFSPVAGALIRYNDSFTILTAQGGVTGTFATPGALSAILTPRFTYTANAVRATIDAGLYRNVVNQGSPVQSAYAQLLDQNRAGNYGALSDTYGFLDLQNAATIQSTLETLAPRTETTRHAIATVAIDNMARFYRERVGGLSTSGLDGSLAVIGRPFEVAAVNLNGLPGRQEVQSDAGTGVVQQDRLPQGVSGFLAGGYLNGHSRSMPGVVPAAGRDSFDGYYIAGGIETEVGAESVVGFGLSYTNVDGRPALASQEADGDLYQGTIYGKSRLGALIIDGVAQAGVFDSRTTRNVALGTTAFRLRSNDHSLALSGELGLGVAFDVSSLTVSPRIAGRAATVLFDQIDEQGGGPALRYARNHLESYQARAGLNLSGHGIIRPTASAYYVHDFADRPAVFGANFAGGVGPDALFRTVGLDRTWGEASVGIGYHGGTVDLAVSADTTFERKDVSNQAYRGSVTIHF